LISTNNSKSFPNLNIVDNALKNCIDLKILSHRSHFISMIIQTNEAYYYAEKYYEDKILSSSLAIKIFKEQKNKIINYHYVLYKVLYYLRNNSSIDCKNFMISLRKNKVKFYKWLEKDGIIDTTTY